MSVSSNLNFQNLLIEVAQKGVSDLYLSAGKGIKAKIGNNLVDWQGEIITETFLEKNILEFLSTKYKAIFERDGSVVFAHEFGDGFRFRINLFRQQGKLVAVMRFIPPKAKLVKDLALPQMVEKFAEVDRGLIIVSGVSGVGKTTTIAGLLEQINQNEAKSVVTLEEPIEYVFANKKSIVEQREIPIDTPNFEQGLKDLLYMDIDVVSVDKLTSGEAAADILSLAEKGLVFLEMTSHSVIDTIDDYITLCTAEKKQDMRKVLANNLVAVLNQVLVDRHGIGRLPVVELMINTAAVASAISEDRTGRIHDLIVTSGHVGMISRERSLAELVRANEVNLDEALKYVDDQEEFKKMVV